MNLFDSPGECNHTCFVKATGNNSQKRISSFVSHVAQRYYETILQEIAKEALEKKDLATFQLVERKKKNAIEMLPQGRYNVTVEGCTHKDGDVMHSCKWAKKDKSKG